MTIYGAGSVPRYNQGLGPRLKKAASNQARPVMGPQDVSHAQPQSALFPSPPTGQVPNMQSMMAPRGQSQGPAMAGWPSNPIDDGIMSLLNRIPRGGPLGSMREILGGSGSPQAASPPVSAPPVSPMPQTPQAPPQSPQPMGSILPRPTSVSPETEAEFEIMQSLGRQDAIQANPMLSGRQAGMTEAQAIGSHIPDGGFSRRGMMGPIGHGFATSEQYRPDMAPGRWGGPAPAAQGPAPPHAAPRGQVVGVDRATASPEAQARMDTADDRMARTWQESGRMATMDPRARSIFNQMAGNPEDAISTPTPSQMPLVRQAIRAARQQAKGERMENVRDTARGRADLRDLRTGNRQPSIQELAQAGNADAMMMLSAQNQQQMQDQMQMQQMMMLEGQDQRAMQSGMMDSYMRMLSQNPNLTAEQLQMMMQQPPGIFQQFGIGMPQGQMEEPITQPEQPQAQGGMFDMLAPMAGGAAGIGRAAGRLGSRFMRRRAGQAAPQVD